TSFVAKSIGENYEDKDIREVISGYLSFTGQGKERQKWSYKLKDKPKEDELLDKIDRIPNSKEIAKVSSSLSNLRNDLNHAGYTKTPSSYDKMLKNLTSYYSKITQKLAEIPTIESTPEIKPVQERFLLNFTNHKFEGWTDKQKEAAIRQFGKVIDLEFPNIPPEYTEKQVQNLVQEYKERILNEYPGCAAIHVMGEFTFTYHFVEQMKDIIPCYASTTERRVELLPDGSRKLYFDFVQFRKYE
ncbi:MAG: hypothetical protein RML38_11115, partial [Bacteroidia bacterium]|nr:hypothetical protein [Bacteroidia bacterium]